MTASTVYTATIETIEIGTQGPPGPPGAIGPAGGSAFESIAGENLSALRIVRLENGKAYYCDADQAVHAGTAAGITLNAALTDEVVTIQSLGKLNDSGFSFTSGPLFVGTMGQLTPIPGTAFVQEIGRAISATELLINLQPAILRI